MIKYTHVTVYKTKFKLVKGQENKIRFLRKLNMAMSEPLGSDILTPSNCGPCLNDNKNNEATMFCVECNDMLCDVCVGIHKRFPTMKLHQIVVQTDKEQFEFTAKLLTDKCGRHEGKHLETFCKKHDELCCSVCVSINHRTCEGLVYLPEHAKEKAAKDFCKDTIEESKHMKSKAEQLIRRINADKIKIERERGTSNAHLDDYRKELIAEINRIHRDSLAEVKSRYDSRIRTADEDVNKCYDQITKLDKVIRSFASETADDARRFIGTKRVAEVIKQTKQPIDGMSERTDIGIEYTLETTLMNSLMGFKTFLKFARKPEGYKYEPKMKTSVSYNITIGKQIYQRQIPNENASCGIQGILPLENSQVMVADWKNSNIKLLNNNLDVTQSVQLHSYPRALCMIDNDICISYKDKNKVDIVTLAGTKVTTKQTFKIGKECRGICYKNNELFVACGNIKTAEVRVYSMEGQLKRIFDRDAKGDKLFYIPNSVKTNAGGSILLVGDNNKGVMALKMDGMLLWKFKGSKVIRDVRDIAVDENDDLYVCCGGTSGYIVKISADGQNAETVLNDIFLPSVLCYDGANGRLIIVKYSAIANNTLIVYQVLKQRK